MRPRPERAPSEHPRTIRMHLAASVLAMPGLPNLSPEGAVGIPNKLLIAWGIGVAAFLALLAGTSIVRPRAPPADPLVRHSREPEQREDGGAWRRTDGAGEAFDEGRELARHVAPESEDALVRHLRALDVGDATLKREGRDVLVHLANCASCRNRPWWKGRRGECAFERGFVTGAFESFSENEVRVDETDCGGRKGACLFRVRPPGTD